MLKMSEHVPLDSFHALQQLDALMSPAGAEQLELEVMKRGGAGRLALIYNDYIPQGTPANALVASGALMMHSEMRIVTDKGLVAPSHNAFKNGYILANIAGTLMLDGETIQEIAGYGNAVIYPAGVNQVQSKTAKEFAKENVKKLGEAGYYNFSQPYHDFIESDRTLNEATATRDHDIFVRYGFG
ncbi:hypothetical protein KA047_02400, partial [Candidatus Saccharibacteria bacterium]|nr:hypothetical protein [Candidatus Saccharibacteria bacterium]